MSTADLCLRATIPLNSAPASHAGQLCIAVGEGWTKAELPVRLLSIVSHWRLTGNARTIWDFFFILPLLCGELEAGWAMCQVPTSTWMCWQAVTAHRISVDMFPIYGTGHFWKGAKFAGSVGHPMTKMLSASLRGLRTSAWPPDQPGFCRWTPLGALLPEPPLQARAPHSPWWSPNRWPFPPPIYGPPWKKSCGRPWPICTMLLALWALRAVNIRDNRPIKTLYCYTIILFIAVVKLA